MSSYSIVCLTFLILFSGGINDEKCLNSAHDNPALPIRVQQALMSAQDSACLSLDSLKNALVRDEAFGWVRLRNGEYSTNAKDSLSGSIVCGGEFTFADLNNDGYKDAIGTLAVNTGGSGWFVSLVIFLNKNGTPLFTTSYFVGDREGVDSIKISGRWLRVFLNKHGPKDPMCCPTLKVEKYFEFTNNKLIEIK